jgi:hypothetical protein
MGIAVALAETPVDIASAVVTAACSDVRPAQIGAIRYTFRWTIDELGIDSSRASDV